MAENSKTYYSDVLDEEEELESQFDIQFFINLFWRNRYWMILSGVLCFLISFFYFKTKTDIYASQMMILITTDKNAGMSNSAQMSFIQDMTGIATYNSLENEKVIIRSTPIAQKVVEEQRLNVRYFTRSTFRTIENLQQEVRMQYIANPAFNVNNLPSIRIDYTLQDTARMLVTITDFSRKRNGHDGVLVRDTAVSLPGIVELPRYGQLLFTYQGGEQETSGERYILLYSPQVRAHEICNSMNVSVVEDSKRSTYSNNSSILLISMQDNIPVRAEQILEGIVHHYNLQTKEYYTLSYTNTMEFIQNRLVDLKDQLSGVEGKIKDFSIGNNVYDLQSQASFNITTDLQRQQRAQEIDIQISLLQMIAKELKEQREYTSIPSNVGIADNGIVSAITEYNRLCVERLRLLSSSSENSPVIRQLYLQLDARRELICKTIDNQITLLTSQHNEIMQQVGDSKSRMQHLPAQRLSLAEIEREQSVIEPLYILLQKKREETMLAIIAEPDIARIVEHSENNTDLIGPNRRRGYLIALLLGLLLPVVIAYVRILLKTKISTPEDITSRTRIPILGIVPQSTTRLVKASDIIAQSASNTIFEVFRSLRACLGFMEGKVYQVTSSVPSEGKSYVSTHLAICFAASGKRTILVETDLRKGHQRRTFEVAKDFRSGLSDYLSGNNKDWHSLLVKVPGAPNLDVMLRGAIPPNPNELLSSNRLEQLIEELKAEYDYVILDSPPYLLIADPISINRVADRNIYVMRAGVSDLRFIDEVDMAARNGKLTKPTIILNGLDIKAQSYYGRSRYGYGYGYAYGYSYGYNEQKGSSTPSFLRRFRR